MGLGAARERLETDPEGGRPLVADAHEEAKAALKEIRDLVRGIHPVILEDRGLDAALSAVVARSPVPVTLDVGGGRAAARRRSRAPPTSWWPRRSPTSPATPTPPGPAWPSPGPATGWSSRCATTAWAAPTRRRGTGLQGLRDRVTALGGTMHVVSPDGGPTTLLVDLPCAS